jgi:actin related protein 2/3 complex, subunit 3
VHHAAEPGVPDIIDETLDLFRANSLFRNFEIKGPADRLLIIMILFISDCLTKITAPRTPPSQIEATKMLNTLAVDSFPLPGDANFPLNAHYAAPPNRMEAGIYHRSLICTMVLTVLFCRFTATIPCSRKAGNSRSIGREALRGWNGKA